MLGESEGTTGTATIEEIGRRKTFVTTTTAAAVLLLVQQPMLHRVRELDGVGPCGIPARLALLVDFLFIASYAVATFRGLRYVRLVGPGSWLALARFGSTLVWLAAAVDVVEDVILWHRFGEESVCSPFTVGRTDWSGNLGIGWVSGLIIVLGVLGFVLLVVAAVASRLRPRHHDVSFVREAERGPDAGRLVIACSGGGIKSASFCLGVLQALFAKGLYDRASSVIGVSGGGYMAAAFHVLRRTGVHPYEPGSPELARLRRQTRYLLQGTRTKLRAALSLLYGLTINLLLIGVTLRMTSWVLGWTLADFGVLSVADHQLEIDLRPGGSWWFLLGSCALLLVGIAAFVIEKAWDRVGVIPDLPRRMLTRSSGTALVAGIPVVLLLLGVPVALYVISKIPATASTEQPSLPQALLALVDPNKQGATTFTAMAVALLGLGRAVWTGLRVETKDQANAGLLNKAIAFLRNKFAAWTGSAIILAAAAIALLRWTGGYATDVEYQRNWSVAGTMAIIAVVLKLFTDANRTSAHPFYRERVATAYLVRRARNGAAVNLDFEKPLRYSEWAKPSAAGGPELVIGAAANAFDADFVPSQRGCVPFVFDPRQIGIIGDSSLPRGGRRPTAQYETDADYLHREVTVPAAMAISSAAFSPLTGRTNSRTRPVRLLLAVLNLRLGVWLPNPYWRHDDSVQPRTRIGRYAASLADKPGPYRLLREAFGNPSLYERRIYVTDGGHYDNLGLVEAVRRRPKQVFVIDGSNDAEDRFNALGEAIATARMDHGITIELDPTPMRRGDNARATQAWTTGTAIHPLQDGDTEPYRTEIFYLKAVVAGELSWDIEKYAAAHPEFPRPSVADQLYDEWDFEAYRSLGNTLAEGMLAAPEIRSRLGTSPDGLATSREAEVAHRW